VGWISVVTCVDRYTALVTIRVAACSTHPPLPRVWLRGHVLVRDGVVVLVSSVFSLRCTQADRIYHVVSAVACT
jgi:hypothetical protein